MTWLDALIYAYRRVAELVLLAGAAVVRLLLEAGADKVGVNTAAVMRPDLLTELAERFGCQCIVLALDASRNDSSWKTVVRSGSEHLSLDAVEWARQATAAGAGEILLTSWDRDGTQSGYDLELLRAISSAVAVPVVASGGARTAEHMVEAIAAGADAVLAASIFHDGDISVSTLKKQLALLGAEVRQ